MSISLHVNRVALSENRIAHIGQAQTLNEAQRMGLFDRIKDWFHGGVKKESIKQVFDLLRSPDNAQLSAHAKASSQENLLLHFNVLRSALRPEHVDKCKLIVEKNEDQGTWSYSMSVNDTQLVVAIGLPIGSGQTLAAFEDYQLLEKLSLCLKRNHQFESVEVRDNFCDTLRERFFDINADASKMAPGEYTGSCLKKFSIINEELLNLKLPNQSLVAGFEFDGNLQTAELWIGHQQLLSYELTDRAVLTDTLATMAHIAGSNANHLAESRNTEKVVISTVQDMVDGNGAQEVVINKLNDEFFCKENFVGWAVVENKPNEFTARFVDSAVGGREESLVFSNRPNIGNEFRATILQQKLSEESYSSLGDLIFQQLGGADDSVLVARTADARTNLLRFEENILKDVDAQNTYGFSGAAEVVEYFNQTWESAGVIKMGKTTLGAAWKSAVRPSIPVLQQELAGSSDGAAATAPSAAASILRSQEIALLVANKA